MRESQVVRLEGCRGGRVDLALELLSGSLQLKDGLLHRVLVAQADLQQ